MGVRARLLSVSLEDPSFSAGYYNLYRNTGVEDGYTPTFERPRAKKDDSAAKQSA
jgi:hypothetical protein